MVYFRGATKIGHESYSDNPQGPDPIPPPGPPLLPWYMNYWIVGGIVAAVIIFAIILYFAMRKPASVEKMYY